MNRNVKKLFTASIFAMQRGSIVIFSSMCLFLLFSLEQVSAQPEFAPIGAEWYYTYSFGCCPEEYFHRVISEKDTIIEGSNCRILKQRYSSDSADMQYIINMDYIIKQEQNKIYHYYLNQFNLFMDFGVQVGDTAQFAFMFKEFYHNDIEWFNRDTILTARFKIEDIETDIENLKTFKSRIIDEDIYKFDGVYHAPYIYTYMEKVGYYDKFMPILDNGGGYPDIVSYFWVRCYSDANFSFISDEWAAIDLPCNYSIYCNLNTPQIKKNIEIYPNPFNESISILANNGKSVEIIDILGKNVYYSDLVDETTEISTNHLPKGIYFAKIKNKDNSVQILKIVKS
ncbi:T9SS type A sorting domain-containing protein [Bacteroidales bacterium OttesenSCG-928-I21]|nr:T9SS type A sorting domain-containing protein [Bacteroidales bacterium OttesenSCG-928-I21]